MNSKTKRALKGIVKECLIEILAEGLVGNQQATLSETRELRGTLHEAYDNAPKSRTISERSISMPTQSSSRTSTSSGKRASYLDSITMGIDKSTDQVAAVDHAKKRASSITNDPIMADILADTAMTTLREQKEGGRPSGPSVMSGGDQAAKIVNQAAPEDLFGESASKWADLAFAPSIRHR